jgi:hypothetical protein
MKRKLRCRKCERKAKKDSRLCFIHGKEVEQKAWRLAHPAACKTNTCKKNAVSRGWCLRHYNAWIRSGVQDPHNPRPLCGVSDCQKSVTSDGWCHRHYKQWKTTGNPIAQRHQEAHRLSKSPEYSSWSQMLGRCYCVSNKFYYRYGGRGIQVCLQWRKSFSQFLKDVGPRPTLRHSIDRINNNGNYEPENVRWATSTMQARNRASTRFITFNGTTLGLADWANKLGIRYPTLNLRLKKGWTVERAFTQPERTPFRPWRRKNG